MGICGFGGLALNAAANDPRIKATVASTMYDMSRVTANGYFDADDSAAKRNEMRTQLAKQRTEDYANGDYARAGGVIDPLPDDAPQFVRDYHAYYKTPRGYHARSVNSNAGWNVTSSLPFMNMPLMTYIGEIENPALLIHGEKAHSLYFSKAAYEKLEHGVNPVSYTNLSSWMSKVMRGYSRRVCAMASATMFIRLLSAAVMCMVPAISSCICTSARARSASSMICRARR